MAFQQQRYALITELNQEWARLIARYGDRPQWADRQPELGPCQNLAEVMAAIRHRPDPVLAALLRETATGDVLAGRTVLQAMLGKAVRLAQAHPDLGVDEFVGALWCRIRTYPLARRPTRIAANLALDMRKDVLAAARDRRRERTAVGLGDHDVDRLLRRRINQDGSVEQPADSQVLQVLELAEATGIIDLATSSALRSVYLDGADSRTAAARLGTSPGMIRYRCSRGLRALARHASELSEAA